jgi:hypothetical protein
VLAARRVLAKLVTSAPTLAIWEKLPEPVFLSIFIPSLSEVSCQVGLIWEDDTTNCYHSDGELGGERTGVLKYR